MIKHKKIGKLFVIGLLIGSLGIPVQASTINDAKETKEKLEESKSKTESQVTKLRKQQEKLKAAIEELDKKVATLDAKLYNLNEDLTSKREQLATTKEELAQAKEDEQVQYEAMKKRIKYMYESGDTGYLEILFQAESISDLLNRAEYVEKISEYDSTMLTRLEEARQKIADTKKKEEQEIQEVKELKAEVQEQRAEVKELRAEKKTQVKKYTANIKKKKALIADYEKQIEEQEQLILQLEEEARKKEEEQKKAEAEKASNDTTSSSSSSSSSQAESTSSGDFTWPCPSSHTITSEYGYRIHPILGTKKFHSGIDVGASTGASIIAAGSGTVTAAGYSSSMGYYVMISHGNGITTVYMHCSSLLVSSGQSVSKGQQIARVGSTGLATGPHLHFSVMKNGSYVNPWDYL